jgi:amino acid permease
VQGLACGYLYAFAFAINLARYSVAFANYLSYWTTMGEAWKRGLAITGFIFVPLFINVLNVRNYGEVEFWLTLVKITAIIGLIIAGIIIAAGGITTPLLGLNAEYRPVPCAENVIGSCIPSAQGFACLSLVNWRLIYRLARECFQVYNVAWELGICCRRVELL